jgi:hypothetical protein
MRVLDVMTTRLLQGQPPERHEGRSVNLPEIDGGGRHRISPLFSPGIC